MTNRFSRLWLAAVSAAALFAPAAASAETLAEALALAYRTNPQLQSQRALQRQLDESYVQARAGFRPQLNATANTGFTDVGGRPSTNSVNAGLSASQPLYTGGRVSAAVNAAEATVLAGRENLRTLEQTVLQQVVQAYQDVLRDQQIVAIRQQSVDVLSNQVSETSARFEAGLLTRTDVARSEAQLAASRAQLTSARAQLQISRANYTTLVGQNPGDLIAPAPLPGLPGGVDEAFTAAEARNPNLRRASIAEQASRYRVAQVRAQRRPTVSLQAGVGTTGTWDPFDVANHSVNVSVAASQPLFAGGAISSQIRASLEANNSDRILIEQARRQAVQAVSQAWNQMLAAEGNIASNQEAERAATVAFEGASEQYRVGLSTTLDVLLAQEALRSAQLNLVQSRRDLYVAQAALLSAMGRLDAASLMQGVPLYDPADSFDRVRFNGAVPWEPVIEAFDAVGAPPPADPTAPIPAPAPTAQAPVLNAPNQAAPPAATAPFSTVTPTRPALPAPAQDATPR